MAPREGSVPRRRPSAPSASSTGRPTSTVPAADGAARRSRIPRLRQRVQPDRPAYVSRAGVGRRSRLRHRPPRAPHRAAQAGHRCASCSTSPALIVADPFDRTRPLWQFIVVEGLRGGKAALIQKMHHTITDGEGGVELSLQYLDFERDAPRAAADRPDQRRASAPPQPSPASTRSRGSARRHAADPDRHRQAGARSARRPGRDPRRQRRPRPTRCAAILSQLSDTETARSPLWTERSLHRHVETARAPFRATKDAAKRARRHAQHRVPHRRRRRRQPRTTSRWAQPVESLRASMAISTRTETSGGQRVLAGAHAGADRRDADRRALRRHRRSDQGRTPVDQATPALDTLAAVATALADVADHAARPPAGPDVDFATSNVEGRADAGATSPARSCSRTTRSARWPASPSTSRCCRTSAASTWASTSTPPRSSRPALLAELLEGSFKQLIRAGTKSGKFGA